MLKEVRLAFVPVYVLHFVRTDEARLNLNIERLCNPGGAQHWRNVTTSLTSWRCPAQAKRRNVSVILTVPGTGETSERLWHPGGARHWRNVRMSYTVRTGEARFN